MKCERRLRRASVVAACALAAAATEAFAQPAPLPQIVEQPRWTPVELGGTASFHVVASGEEPLTYQWFRAGRAIPGATGPILVISNAAHSDAGPYYVRVTDPCGHVISRSKDLVVHESGAADLLPGLLCAPGVARADPVPTSLDLNQDKIWDLLNEQDDVRHNILVDFRVCVTDSHEAFLEDVSSESSVTRVYRHISTVAMANASLAEMLLIAGHIDVALIEKQLEYVPTLDVSLPTIRVTGPAPSVAAEFPELTGLSVNIAIIDTGVDDAIHETLPFAFAGYNALTDVEGNPDDDVNHGTGVASVALGRGGSLVSRGVAPEANLVDVKIIGTFDPLPPWDPALAGLDWVIDNQRTRLELNIHVVNMSFGRIDPFTGDPVPSDGTDALSSLVDQLVGLGIVAVAAAGNNGNLCNTGDPDTYPYDLTPGPITAPGAAAGAITVAASDDLGIPDRGNDLIADFSTPGPRLTGGFVPDAGPWPIDVLKPEVTAPGANIFTALFDDTVGGAEMSGTSFAAPHVTGLAALAVQADPERSWMIKRNLIDTAERRGPSSWPSHPFAGDWNKCWGWGLVDGYEFLLGYTTWLTDVDFNRLGSPRHWAQRSIFPEEELVGGSPRVGVSTRLIARLRNNGPSIARDVRVDFFVQTLTASVPTFSYIGSDTIDEIPISDGQIGTTRDASVEWTPQCLSWSGSRQRCGQCVRAVISYPLDTIPSNNEVIRNIWFSSSPVYFDVRNFVSSGAETITFVVEAEHPEWGWGLELTPSSVTIGSDDVPPAIQANPIPPLGTPDGTQETFHIEAVAGGKCLGGVTIVGTMHDCNSTGVNDWFEIRDGTSADCNTNGVPDECDIAAGTSLDVDPPNGIPDECTIPDACVTCPGDVDGDGDVDGNDIAPFIACITTPAACMSACADLDGSGTVTDVDVAPFIARVLAGDLCTP